MIITSAKAFRHLTLLLLLPLCALAIASCGSDDDEPTPPAAAPDYSKAVTYSGTTVIRCTDDLALEPATNTTMTYTLTFDVEASKVTMMINKANFGFNMPISLDMELRDLPLQTDGEAFSFAAPSSTPYVGGAPFTRAPITGISAKGTIGANATLDLQFDCDASAMTRHTFHITAEGLTGAVASAKSY